MNKKTILLMAVGSILTSGMSAKSLLHALKVEYLKSPLAISVQQPHFAWQMTSDDNVRGWQQNAYQISVTDETGKEVWNSGKVKSGNSLNIKYEGQSLRPATRYQWNLKVWNQKNEELNESSFFETALVMAPDYNHTIQAMSTDGNLKAWDGAKWIGRAHDAVMFYAPYFPIFRLNYNIQLDKKSKTSMASFIFGANDPRLMDNNKNLLGVSNPKDSSYIRVELDITPLKKKQSALINIYRKGYQVGENDNQPIASYKIAQDIIDNSNKYDTHKISIAVNAGATSLYIDDKDVITDKVIEDTDGKKKSFGSLNLNPTGKHGNDYIAYPVIADLGYQLAPKQKAIFSQIEIRNYRDPQNVILDAQQEPLLIEGNKTGYFRTFKLKENPAPMLRTAFNTQGKKIAKARLYATAHGIYDLYINGQQVSPAYFNPGTTQYERTQTYQTFDVTPLLKEGRNALGAILAEGWWSGGATYVTGNWNLFGDRQSLLAKLQITYEDGTQQNIITDPQTWKTYDDGAVRYGSFFMGEVYDAQKAQKLKDWTMPSYDDANWKQAIEVKQDNFQTTNDFQMLPDMAEAIMPVDTLKALSMEEPRKGVYVYDLGQNMAGVPLIKFKGVKPGTEIKIRTAEIKYPDLPRYKENVGMIMTENLRVATSQDVYIAKGGEETFSPRFTLHGFRYLEITGVDKPVEKENVKAIVVSSMNENSSVFKTSREDINRLWLNSMWSTRANFMSVPTDCPQRNERLGWMGDISVFSRSASYITDASKFLRRFLISVRDMQNENGQYPDVAPTNCGFGGLLWGSAGITVPWELYQQYGDKGMLQEHYPSMKRYIQFVLDNYIDKNTNLIVQKGEWTDLGDWLSPSYEKDDKSLIWECYFIFDLDIMTQLAQVLGKADDAKKFADLAQQRRAFFQQTYLDPITGKTRFSAFNQAKKGQLIDTQTSYTLPLAFKVVDNDKQKQLAEHLGNAVKRSADGFPGYSLLTGFIGTAWISKALSENGMSDIAYRLLEQDTYPSWLYPVRNGATSIWERLNSYTIQDGFGENNSMNSFNHYSFGSVAAWMYNYSLGIRRDKNQPGFKHFFLQPEVDPTGGISHAEGYYDSMYGRIKSQWKKTDDGREYSFTVPANTTATLFLPARKKTDITESGKSIAKALGIKYIRESDGLHQMELQSGTYQFKIKE